MTEEEIATGYNLPRAKCAAYDPKSESEGKCCITGGLVSRFGGCNFPEKCPDRSRRAGQQSLDMAHDLEYWRKL